MAIHFRVGNKEWRTARWKVIVYSLCDKEVRMMDATRDKRMVTCRACRRKLDSI